MSSCKHLHVRFETTVPHAGKVLETVQYKYLLGKEQRLLLYFELPVWTQASEINRMVRSLKEQVKPAERLG